MVQAKKPFLIAVSGGSGSGKTTFVRELAEHLCHYKPLLLSTDHYYRDLSHMPIDERQAQNFDHPEALELSLLKTHISSLCSGQGIERPHYDFKHHTRMTGQSTFLEPSQLIILDGIFALCFSDLLSFFDLKLYVDVDHDIRVIRRLKRDVEERGRSLESTARQYIESVRPMHHQFIEPSKVHADFLIPWSQFNPAAITYTAHIVENHLAAYRSNHFPKKLDKFCPPSAISSVLSSKG